MSLTATSRAIPGTLRNEIVVNGKHRLITDEPEAAGGGDRAAAPHELLVAALAGCVSTTLVMYANRKGWDLGEVTVHADYDHKATPRRVELAIEVTADLAPEQLERLEQIAAACPVRRSLEAGFAFHEQLVHAPSAEVIPAG